MLARARAVTLWNYPDMARCLGVDPYAILTRAGLRASSLNDIENWLPGRQILDVIEETARVAKRDDIGILLGEFRSFATLSSFSRWFASEFGMPPSEWKRGSVRRLEPAMTAALLTAQEIG